MIFRTPFARLRNGLLLVVACVVLAACQTEVYSNLTEREANEMLSALLEENINASKNAVGDGVFAVTVENAAVRDALAVLASKGLPRETRERIGEVFAKSGIVSSPFEERVRYVYALGEEVAQTLMEIDGVLVARVHIVMPEEPGLGQEVKPSSAAVFIKQRAGFDVDFLVPQIRRLTANAIEGVDYEQVTVVLIKAQPELTSDRREGPQLAEPLPGLRLDTASMGMFMTTAGSAGAVLVLLLLTSVLLFVSNQRMRSKLSRIEAEDDE